jgi:hypothetical protein
MASGGLAGAALRVSERDFLDRQTDWRGRYLQLGWMCKRIQIFTKKTDSVVAFLSSNTRNNSCSVCRFLSKQNILQELSRREE